MLRFETRPEDGGFDDDNQTHRDAVAAFATAAQWDRVADHLDNHQTWGSLTVKATYLEHQKGKCAYCERRITDYGDVEHFRPKGAVYVLKAKGAERPFLNNIVGRKFHKSQADHPNAWARGYWWLAWRWANYMVACGRCNQNWKNALFPVRGGRAREPQEGDEVTETPLLLDPYGPEQPADHLRFTVLGAVAPVGGSDIGQGTIDVVGLDRPSLLLSRSGIANLVSAVLDDWDDAMAEHSPVTAPDAELSPLAIRLVALGAAVMPHAGMVRILAQHRTGWTWADLEAFAAT